jgi:hypothetical protein
MCLGNCTLAYSVMTLWVVLPSLYMLHLAESAFSTRSTKDTVPAAFATQASDSVHDTSLGALCPNICSRFLFGPESTIYTLVDSGEASMLDSQSNFCD